MHETANIRMDSEGITFDLPRRRSVRVEPAPSDAEVFSSLMTSLVAMVPDNDTGPTTSERAGERMREYLADIQQQGVFPVLDRDFGHPPPRAQAQQATCIKIGLVGEHAQVTVRFDVDCERYVVNIDKAFRTICEVCLLVAARLVPDAFAMLDRFSRIIPEGEVLSVGEVFAESPNPKWPEPDHMFVQRGGQA